MHIEYCGKCHGIFLDQGELDEAVKVVAGSTVRQVLTLAGADRQVVIPSLVLRVADARSAVKRLKSRRSRP